MYLSLPSAKTVGEKYKLINKIDSMNLMDKINDDLKSAMKNKEKEKLEAIRAVKTALLLARTEAGAGDVMSDEDEIKLLQRLVKQRRESAAEYAKLNREDLASKEIIEADVISAYLPEQMSAEEIEAGVKAVIAEIGAEGMKDMGKVMAAASKAFAGKADGKAISEAVKRLLA